MNGKETINRNMHQKEMGKTQAATHKANTRARMPRSARETSNTTLHVCGNTPQDGGRTVASHTRSTSIDRTHKLMQAGSRSSTRTFGGCAFGGTSNNFSFLEPALTEVESDLGGFVCVSIVEVEEGLDHGDVRVKKVVSPMGSQLGEGNVQGSGMRHMGAILPTPG